jgi:hypothetical protein
MFYAVLPNATKSAESNDKSTLLNFTSVSLANRSPFFLLEVPCNTQVGTDTRPMLLSGLNEVQLAMITIEGSLAENHLSMIFYPDKAENAAWQCQRVESIWHGEYGMGRKASNAIRVNFFNGEILKIMSKSLDDPAAIEWKQLL